MLTTRFWGYHALIFSVSSSLQFRRETAVCCGDLHHFLQMLQGIAFLELLTVRSHCRAIPCVGKRPLDTLGLDSLGNLHIFLFGYCTFYRNNFGGTNGRSVIGIMSVTFELTLDILRTWNPFLRL